MKNVLLVFGGVSYEHDISIVTAFQIYKKARLNDVSLKLFYVSRDGKFYICDEKKVTISDFSKTKFSGNNRGIREVVFVSGEKGKLFVKTHFGLKEIFDADVAIFACHGGDGENGKLVTIFENQGIACSAGSSDALAVCMDKFLFKSICKGLKIPVVSGFKISKTEFANNKDVIARNLARLGFPVILKINSGGSSIGLFKANTIEEFTEKIKQAFEFDEMVVAEKFIKNTREFNVAILGDEQNFEISEIDEPLKNNDVLTFADKYLSGAKSSKGEKGSMSSILRKTPENLSSQNVLKMKKIAEKIFIKLGLYGVIRIDFLFDELNDKIYVCEVNSIPGSLAYYFFKKNRIITNDLIEKLIAVAEKNYKKDKIKQEFMVDILSKK